MAAAAGIEYNGVPIDMPFLDRLRTHWESVKIHLIAGIDARYGVYDGQTFKMGNSPNISGNAIFLGQS